jgi:hypothetical protein
LKDIKEIASWSSRRENIYVLGYCEACLVAIVREYEQRLEDPIDVEIVQQ